MYIQPLMYIQFSCFELPKLNYQFAENNVFLEDILNAGPDGEYDSANEYRKPEDPHAADVLAAKRARELERDPNYVPSVEVCAQHTRAV